MKLKFLIHGICCCTIAFLLVKATRNHQQLGEELALRQEVASTAQLSKQFIEKSIRKRLIDLEINYYKYPSKQALTYLSRAEQAAEQYKALSSALDSLKHHPQSDQAQQIAKRLIDYRHEMIALTDSAREFIAYFPKESTLIRPLDALNPESQQDFRATIVLTQIQLDAIALEGLNYCLARVQGIECFRNMTWSRFIPDLLNSVTGDSIRAKIFVSMNSSVHYIPQAFLLNGVKLTETTNHFTHAITKYHFPKPGIYPIHAAVIAKNIYTEEIDTFQATYRIRVQ
jgi:hypothetical protein